MSDFGEVGGGGVDPAPIAPAAAAGGRRIFSDPEISPLFRSESRSNHSVPVVAVALAIVLEDMRRVLRSFWGRFGVLPVAVGVSSLCLALQLEVCS